MAALHSHSLQGCLHKSIIIPSRRTGQDLTGGWRKLKNKQLHDLYYSTIREDEIGGVCRMQKREDKCIQRHHFKKVTKETIYVRPRHKKNSMV
jgi:hypothetical protein